MPTIIKIAPTGWARFKEIEVAGLGTIPKSSFSFLGTYYEYAHPAQAPASGQATIRYNRD